MPTKKTPQQPSPPTKGSKPTKIKNTKQQHPPTTTKVAKPSKVVKQPSKTLKPSKPSKIKEIIPEKPVSNLAYTRKLKKIITDIRNKDLRYSSAPVRFGWEL